MEVMLEDSFQYNGYEHRITVFDNGKIIDKVIGHNPVPDAVMGLLDYPSFEVLIKNSKKTFTLANRYIGMNPENLVNQIEEKIYS